MKYFKNSLLKDQNTPILPWQAVAHTVPRTDHVRGTVCETKLSNWFESALSKKMVSSTRSQTGHLCHAPMRCGIRALDFNADPLQSVCTCFQHSLRDPWDQFLYCFGPKASTYPNPVVQNRKLVYETIFIWPPLLGIQCHGSCGDVRCCIWAISP